MGYLTNGRKKICTYYEQKPEEVAQYCQQLRNLSHLTLVYIDETGFDRYFYRPYGRTLRGQVVKGKISGKRYARISLVAGLVGKQLIAPMTYKETMTSDFFEAWFECFLLPSLKTRSVIIMDNARFHRMSRLKEYVAVSEKITEDRERRRIAREIHDTIGHALTGISAGIDAVTVLIDLDPDNAKKQLTNVSNVVREGIVDVRRSLNKMRPGALENRNLKDAIEKMLAEYQELSHLQIDLNYQWENIDFDKTKEDVIFRVIQESVTNSLRHGQATEIKISMLNKDD